MSVDNKALANISKKIKVTELQLDKFVQVFAISYLITSPMTSTVPAQSPNVEHKARKTRRLSAVYSYGMK
jgi:hypothetical protein